MEYYSAIEKKWASKPWKDPEKPYMHIATQKKPIWKRYILYDSKYRAFWKWWNFGDNKKMGVSQGLGMGEG